MAESGLDSLAQTHGIAIDWRAYELLPGGKFPGGPEQAAKFRTMIDAKQNDMFATARERFGLEMRAGAFGVDSRPALEGSKFARRHALEAEYVRACFTAHWQDGLRLDDPAVLGEIAANVGLDAVRFLAAVQSGAHQAEVQADLDEARALGISGVPAMIFGERLLVSGAQPVDVLRRAADQCIAQGYSSAD